MPELYNAIITNQEQKQKSPAHLPTKTSKKVVVVLIQLVDSSSGLGVERTLDVLELLRAAVTSKRPLGEEFNKVVVAVAGDTTRVAEPCFLGWIGIAGQARVDSLSNVSCTV